jgi:hypothetical protein
VKKHFIFIGFILTGLSCERFFVDDISDTKIELNTPPDNQIITKSDIDFTWSEVNDAEDYNLIVVSPGYYSSYNIIYDTTTSTTSFNGVFAPGLYQWYVKAENYHSVVYSDTLSFSVDSTGSVINNMPVIVQPKNIYYNSIAITFEWGKVISADKYRFEIKKNTWSSKSPLFAEDTIGNSMEVELGEGVYYWGVQAIHKNLYGSFAYQKIVIDTIVPSKPVLSKPVNNASFTSSIVAFSWLHDNVSTAPVYDSLFIAHDEDFQEITTSQESENNTLTLDLDNGTYYWYVMSYDLAGNISKKSQTYTFTVNE